VTKKAVTSLDLVNQDKDRDENSFDRQMKEYSKFRRRICSCDRLRP